MEMSKWQSTFYLFCICIVSICQGEDLVITHRPAYVHLKDNVDTIRVSDVQHVLSAIHGFTLHKDLEFTGLYAASPFHHPKSSAVISLYGGGEITKQLQEPKLNLKVDDVYVPSHTLQHNLEHFYEKQSNVIDISHESKVNDFDGVLEGLRDDEPTVRRIIGDIFQVKLLNVTEPEFFQLMRQMAVILQSLDKVAEHGAGIGDFYSFELYIPSSDNSAVEREIKALLSTFLERVNTRLSELYVDDYVVFVLGLPEANVVKSRKTRSLLATEDDIVQNGTLANANLATAYTEDYPVIFHIILWLVVFMALLVLFGMYGMMTMDLGNDSIIYRMTTTRLKKD